MSSNSHPPIGQLINVGSHQLHIYSTGEGSPSVVFESGGASWSLDWTLVQSEVAKFTNACSYDRAGFGWSESGPNPRSSEQIVAELHTLLTRAEIKKPYILVGASFGGHTARLFGIISKNGGSETYPHDQPRLSSRARLATRIDMGGI